MLLRSGASVATPHDVPPTPDDRRNLLGGDLLGRDGFRGFSGFDLVQMSFTLSGFLASALFNQPCSLLGLAQVAAGVGRTFAHPHHGHGWVVLPPIHVAVLALLVTGFARLPDTGARD